MYVNKQNLITFVKTADLTDESVFTSNGIRFIDAEENLFIITKTNDQNNCNGEIFNESNGIIFEKNTKKIVCTNQNNFKKIENKKISEFPSNSIFEYSEDGTVIRLYFNKTWKTATCNCSDAKYSFWGSDVSFDEQFWQVFDKRDLQRLDKRNTYIFILKHAESQRIVKHKNNELIFVSSVSNVNGFENINYFKEPTFTKLKKSQKIPKSWKKVRFLVTRQESIATHTEESGMFTFDERIHHEVYELLVPIYFDENTIDLTTILQDKTVVYKKLPTDEIVDASIPVKSFHFLNNKLRNLQTLDDYYLSFKRGVLVKVPDEMDSYTTYQYDFENYKKLDELRGNLPTLEDRFLELYLKRDFKTIKSLEAYYRKDSKQIKEKLFHLYKTIFELYSQTHKQHLFKVDETHRYFTTLKQIHAIFYTKNKTTEDVLCEVKEKLENLEKMEKMSPEKEFVKKLETIPENETVEFDPIPTSNKKMIGITYFDVVNHINSLNYTIVKNLI